MATLYFADLTIAVFAVAALLGLGYATLSPRQTIQFILVFTAAFPKAGVKIADFPFPVALPLLLLTALLLRHLHGFKPLTAPQSLAVLAYVGWMLIRISEFADEGAVTVAALLAWSVFPVMILLLAGRLDETPAYVLRCLQIGFIISVAYAVVQTVLGIEQTAIPGLTHALNDDILLKNNFLGMSDGVDVTKTPSTYQNGNIYGVVAAFFLIVNAQRFFRGDRTKMTFLSAAGAAVAIALSGSRTAIVVTIATLGILLLASGTAVRKVKVASMVAIVGVAVLTLRPELISRYSLDAVISTGGAGRTTLWTRFIAVTPTREWLLGAEERRPPEGWAGMVVDLGLVGLVLLALVLAVLTASRLAAPIMLLAMGVGGFLDSSYALFPTWFVAAVLIIAAGPRPREAAEPGLDDTSDIGRPTPRAQSGPAPWGP